jgi:methylated-DNA-[protein]-cysteine S-methyltransferase
MWTVIDTPIGQLRLVATGGFLVAVDFLGDMAGPRTSSMDLAAARADGLPLGDRTDDEPVLVEACRQLAAYFARDLDDFHLPLAPRGTDFQQRVWAELRAIKHGDTASYGEIARRLGLTGHGARAVGLANGRNPIPVVIPCHRVVGANGSLTGYGGGLDRKTFLLDLERDRLF